VLTARVVLPGLSCSVPTARDFVESILTSWGRADAAWTGALLVSELAANCALHARTEFSVTVHQGDEGRLRIEVADGSARVPQQRSYGLDATTGRGLRLVSQLAADWGVATRDGGKTVWVDLPVDGQERDGTDDGEVDATEALLAAFDDDGWSATNVHAAAAPSARERRDLAS
jgi:anti-sigma regulatory factor (Ser/Thr protein kinase)